jgi:hypothetical protein
MVQFDPAVRGFGEAAAPSAGEVLARDGADFDEPAQRHAERPVRTEPTPLTAATSRLVMTSGRGHLTVRCGGRSLPQVTRTPRRRILGLLGLVVLLSFGFASFEASSAHTDDGCAVELHCFACYWSFTSNGVVALAIIHGPILERTGDIVTLDAPQPVEAPAPAETPRSPPLA